MNTARKRKLLIILSCLVVAAVGTAFILTSLSQNINLFYTPTQVSQGEAAPDTIIRVGGLVVEQSVQRTEGTLLSFRVTDTNETIPVRFDGILPDLFQEGQAVVIKGAVDRQGVFIASEVLAKHDENYIPAEAAEAIMQAQKSR